MAVVTIGVILAIGLYILQEVDLSIGQSANSDYTVASAAATPANNATRSLITKLGTAPTWIGLLIVVVFASAILSYFYFRG